MSRSIEVKHKRMTVKVYASQTSKNGNVYTMYQVADYSSADGRRRLWSLADESKARVKAQELAEGKATGNDETFVYAALKRPIQNAPEQARGTGMRIDDAVRLRQGAAHRDEIHSEADALCRCGCCRN